MEANLSTRSRFPYSNWGPAAALLGVFAALLAGIFLGVPAILVDGGAGEGDDLGTAASSVVQLATALGFLLVPLWVARRAGARGLATAFGRLGFRRFRVGRALKWGVAAVGIYMLFAIVYTAIFGAPEQEDIAESFGPLPIQIGLIVIAASISEEVCFRGMLFGGLRERLPMSAAALLSGLVFGALHALTGISAVPPLVAFGFALALLYEKTGSLVPPILLHMLNNSVALLAQ